MKKNTASQLFGTFLPYPIINSVTLESGGATGLKVNLKVAVRDILDTAGMTSFFDKQDVLELLDMVIIQSTDATLTSNLMSTYPGSPGIEFYINLYYETVGNPPGLEFHKQALNFNESADFTTQINGNNVIEKTYNFDFMLPTDKPAHLSYICVVAVSREALAAKYNIEHTDLNEFFSSGETEDYLESTHKVVIDGGSTVNVEHGYYLPNGQKWEGPVHYHNGTWMAGKKHTEAAHPNLTKKMTTSAAVIKDFRDFTDLPLTKEEFYNDQNNLASLISTPFGNKFSDVIVGPKKSSLIYDTISYSIPYKANKKTLSKVGLIFGLDMKEIQKQYSFIKSIDIALPHTKIKTFSVFRTNLETNDAPESVIKNTPPGQYLQDIFGSPSNYSFFHIPDIVEPGNYEYHIELELDKQKEINAINGVLNGLLAFVDILEMYYSAATKTFTKPVTTLGNKTEIVGSTIDEQEQHSYVPFFNSTTGKFRPEFKNAMAGSPGYSVMEIYNEILTRLPLLKGWSASLYTGQAAIMNSQLLDKVLSPETGTPDGILMVKKITENLLQDWGKIFGGTKHLASNGATSYSGEIGETRRATKTRTPEKIIIKLKSKLEVKDNLDYGYDYLPKYNNLPGAPVYNLSQWINTVSSEYNKYFAGFPTEISQYATTKGTLPNPLSHYEGYTTFSPHTTKAGQVTLTPQSDPITFETCLLSIVDRNLGGVEANNKGIEYIKNVPGITLNATKILNSSKQLEEIFSTEGISILPSNPFETNKLYTITNQEEKGSYTFLPEDQLTDSINYNGKLVENFNSKVVLMNMIRALDTNYSQLKSINFYSLKDIAQNGAGFGSAELPLDNDSIIKAFKQKASLVGPSFLDTFNQTWTYKTGPGAPQPGSPGYEAYAAIQVEKEKQAKQADFIEYSKNYINEGVDNLIKQLPMQTLSLMVGSVPPLIDATSPDFDNTLNTEFVNQGTNPFFSTSGQPEDPRKDFESGYAKQWFNFDNLVRVEYLSGFNQGILNPQWKNIKSLLYPSKGNILCRLVKYQNSMINIGRPEVLELPIYNEYFFIKYDQNLTIGSAAQATPPPQQMDVIQPAALKTTADDFISGPIGLTGNLKVYWAGSPGHDGQGGISPVPTGQAVPMFSTASPGPGQGGISPVKTGQAVSMNGIYKIGSKL